MTAMKPFVTHKLLRAYDLIFYAQQKPYENTNVLRTILMLNCKS